MLDTTELLTSAPAAARRTRWRAPFAVALMSFSALLLELGLTRLFSVVLFYHFAFLAISIALLGLGAGAVFTHLRRDWLTRWSVENLGSALCAANACFVFAVLEIVLHTSVSLSLSWPNFWRLTVLYLASAVPFFVTGLLFSIVFARNPERITQLYGADLLGGSLACLALVPLLNFLGGPNTILLAGVVVALAGVAWAGGGLQPARKGNEPVERGAKALHYPAVIAIAMLALIAANFHDKLIDIVYAKGMKREAPLFARWNALSRVEVDQQGRGRAIVIDADAQTSLMNTDPHHWSDGYRAKLMSEPASLANVLRPHGDFAIIGPGGGVDVLRAVANGSPNVTGIEINPIIANDIMRDRFADYAYHLYQIPEVHLHVSDGRSFVRNSRDRYDVVQMTLVDTWASTAAGAFALSENNLYTVEAFREYFEHLKPDGMIAITRWEFARPREALRVVSQAMEALHQMGVQDSSQNFIVVSDGALEEDGEAVIVLAKKSPFTLEEQRAVLNHIQGDASGDSNLNLHVLYLPVTAARPGMAHPAFAELIRRQDARAFSAAYSYNVAPVTDNAPFFFFTLKPEQVLRGSDAGGIDWKVNLGIAIQGIVLIVSVAAVIAFLVLPLALSPETRSGRSLHVLYFVAIGLGYIMVEIALIQRFVLFLGYPTYALTVVVFLMLLSSGAGSLASRRWFSEPARVGVAIVFIVAALAIYLFALPRLIDAMIGLPFGAKLLMSGLLLIPLGFAMGMPFPSGLRALADSHHGAVEWAWAMNAGASVLGSVLAIVVAIQFGLTATHACGAAAYIGAMLLLPAFPRAEIGNQLSAESHQRA
jgi:spermidine synthase